MALRGGPAAASGSAAASAAGAAGVGAASGAGAAAAGAAAAGAEAGTAGTGGATGAGAGGRRGRGCGRALDCRSRRRGRDRSDRGRTRRSCAGLGDDAGGPDHAVRGRCRLVGRRRRGLAGVDHGSRGRRDVVSGLARPRGSLLRLGLLGFGFVDDRLAAQTLGVSEATDAVRGGIVDARRVALDADLQAFGQVDDDLVLDAELSGQLVDADLLRCQARCLLPCQLSASLARSRSRSPMRTVVRSARSSARRRIDSSRHCTGCAAHSHAPRPGPAPRTGPSGPGWIRTSVSTGPFRRHPTQVRSGLRGLFGGRIRARDARFFLCRSLAHGAFGSRFRFLVGHGRYVGRRLGRHVRGTASATTSGVASGVASAATSGAGAA